MAGILWAVLDSFPATASIYPEGSPHHVTLIFGEERHKYESYIGQKILLNVYQECWDERIQALRVLLPGGFPCNNDHPHITVSYCKPVESNTMLLNPQHSRFVNFTLPATIDWHEFK